MKLIRFKKTSFMRPRELRTTSGICFAFHWNDDALFATTDLNEMYNTLFVGDTELCIGRKLTIDNKEYVIEKIRGFADLSGAQGYKLSGVKYSYTFVLISEVRPMFKL